jgi:excinuclease UvrABC ATPase subunit
VIVIEHNLDVVARADWVIDLGPGAGHEGGRVIFEGPPAELVRATDSLTGQHLHRRTSTGDTQVTV